MQKIKIGNDEGKSNTNKQYTNQRFFPLSLFLFPFLFPFPFPFSKFRFQRTEHRYEKNQ